jgi:hypothetical protein
MSDEPEVSSRENVFLHSVSIVEPEDTLKSGVSKQLNLTRKR